MNIKILQWNILYEEKVSHIIGELKKINADIICLQELTKNSPYNKNTDLSKKISKQLNLYYYFGPAAKSSMNDSGLNFDIGNAIFSKYPLKKTDVKIIHKPTKKTPSGPAKEPRIYIETKIKINNKMLNIGTTHLSYTPRFEIKKWRKAQTDKLINLIKTKKNNYILCGDFNATPNSYVIKEVSKYLKSAGPNHKQKTWTTKPFEAFDFKEDKLRWRLDYVFATKDVTVKSSRILKVKPSDHLPILAEVEI